MTSDKNKIQPDLIQFLFTLPSFVVVNDVEFHLKFFINHAGYDGRLVYEPFLPPLDPAWQHPLGWHGKNFLWLIENIGNEQDLREAIESTRQFLISIQVDLLTPSDWQELL